MRSWRKTPPRSPPLALISPVAEIVKGGKYTSAQADKALELVNEKLGLTIRFCEDLGQQWEAWAEREQAKGRPERELTFGEFVDETGMRDEVRAQFLRIANGETPRGLIADVV